MGSGCGTFASSSPLEGDIDYSYWPKVGADDKETYKQAAAMPWSLAYRPISKRSSGQY